MLANESREARRNLPTEPMQQLKLILVDRFPLSDSAGQESEHFESCNLLEVDLSMARRERALPTEGYAICTGWYLCGECSWTKCEWVIVPFVWN